MTGNIKLAWDMHSQERKAQQQVIKTAQSITSTHLPSISDIGEVRWLHRAQG